MTLILELQPELEKRLADAAQGESMAVGSYVLQVLEKHVPSEQRKKSAIALLQSWIDNKQRLSQDDGEDFCALLDEDRMSERKLFPAELKGLTW